MKVINTRLQQQGSVSLFIVVFAALLIITMTTAFIRIMLQDQLQATANDLSKSALDSAYAGVEDAKRAIVSYYQAGCDGATPPSVAACNLNDVDANGWTDGCTKATHDTGVATLTNGEVLVQTAGSDDQFDQAYTCVKVQLNPDNYVGKLTENTSTIVPLKTKDAGGFDKVRIEWYTAQDGADINDSDIDPTVNPLDFKLQKSHDWPATRPSMIRAQLLQYDQDEGFKLSYFDNIPEDPTDPSAIDPAKHNSTIFLYPTDTDRDSSGAFFENGRRTGVAANPTPAGCDKGTASFTKTYACQVTITLPSVTNSDQRVAYLNLTKIYNRSTTYRITLLKSDGTSAKFSGVQPVVDATGRANDLFRRVQSRIGLGSATAPDSAIDITDKLCKEFTVTDDQYVKGNDCSM